MMQNSLSESVTFHAHVSEKKGGSEGARGDISSDRRSCVCQDFVGREVKPFRIFKPMGIIQGDLGGYNEKN